MTDVSKSPAKNQTSNKKTPSCKSQSLQIKANSKPFFSIVIPTLNEEKYLPFLLQDLVDQTYRDFEVIVVDGKSKDHTIQKAKIFQETLNLRVHISSQTGVAHQRNLGSRHSSGSWIIFMDADNRIPRYFLDGIKYQLAKNSKVKVFTCLISPDSNSPTVKIIAQAINSIMLLYEFRRSPFAMGALIGVEKEVAISHEFDSDLALAEDHAFVRKIHKQGHFFQVFREPQFTYSLRRLRKEGALKMAAIEAKILLNSISGSAKNSNFGYVMKGGDYYNKNSTQSKKNLIKGITKQQWQKLSSFLQKYIRRYW